MSCPIHPHNPHHVHTPQGEDRDAFRVFVQHSVRTAQANDPTLRGSIDFLLCWGDPEFQACGYYAATPSSKARIALRWEDHAHQWSQCLVDEIVRTCLSQHRSQSGAVTQ